MNTATTGVHIVSCRRIRSVLCGHIGIGDSPEDDSYDAWKICVFGEYDFEGDTINCGTDYTKCWRYVASKAVEGTLNDNTQRKNLYSNQPASL